MKREKLLIVFLAVIVIAIVISLNINLKSTGKNVSNPGSPTNITYSNLAQVLSGNSMIKALPDNSNVVLQFYNFNSGSRAIEKSYILKNTGVAEGTVANADLTISISSRYMNGLNTWNFCSMVKTAKKNGDLGTESSLSTPSLLWKFKSMMKYKDCFGM
ncbi:MAG: hypothetical protein Q7R52_05550 [archaeon]|nr:hypothetical protein [archaeon]